LYPGPESSDAAFFRLEDIPWNELSFRTVSTTLQHYVEDAKTGVFPIHHYDLTTRIEHRRAEVSGPIWLEPDTPFPEPEMALPGGLLAAGGELTVPRLVEAYSKGVFPWFNEGDPVLWWSPDPRMVLPCSQFKVSRSLGKKLRQIGRSEERR